MTNWFSWYYGDRGPQSYDVLQYWLTFRKNTAMTKLCYWEEITSKWQWKLKPATLITSMAMIFRDFKINKDSIENYYELFNRLPLIYEDKSFICVHGGIRPGVNGRPIPRLIVDTRRIWIIKNFIKPIILVIHPLHINGTMFVYGKRQNRNW